jgi:hypothetical protein
MKTMTYRAAWRAALSFDAAQHFDAAFSCCDAAKIAGPGVLEGFPVRWSGRNGTVSNSAKSPAALTPTR